MNLLFDATWSVLVVCNQKLDDDNKSTTKSITKAVDDYILTNHSERKNLLPELLANHGKNLQKLAATKLFRVYLDSHMKSGVMSLYYLEVSMFILFTFLFARYSIAFKHCKSWYELTLIDFSEEDFSSLHTYMLLIMSLVAEELFWGVSLAIYFLLRELAQFWALFKLGVHMSWFDDYWNFIDVMASGGTIALCAYSVRNGPGPGYEQFASFISIFVWLKLLGKLIRRSPYRYLFLTLKLTLNVFSGYMKAYSQSIATFVLMLSQILRDLRSFLGVLLIVIVMFGHAFYLVLSHTTIAGDKGWSWIWNHTEFNSTIYDATPNFQSIDGQDCWSDGWYDSSTQLVRCNCHYDQNATEIYFFTNVTNSTTTNNFNDDMYEGDIDFSTVPSTAFSLYLMVLGNFEPAAITGLWANALFFFYSFLVFIILLNVLIAIVSDSYDDVLVKSSELFWLNRTNLIAEITSTFGWALIEDGNANIAMRTWFLVLKFLGAFKDNLRIAYGVKSDHKWSIKKNKWYGVAWRGGSLSCR